jgi:glycosyltransferase involved in cell wall biosynthesis
MMIMNHFEAMFRKIYLRFRHVLPFGVRRFLSKTYYAFNRRKFASGVLGNDPSPDFSNSVELRELFAGKNVILIQPTFMNRQGNLYMYGGAERYVLELEKIVRSLGLNMLVVQLGDRENKNGFWICNYNAVQVVGLSIENPENLILEIEQFLIHDALIIFSPFTLAMNSKKKIRSIGISHGVFWDSPNYHTNQNALHAAVNRINRLVSVDTNTVNSLRSLGMGEVIKNKYEIIKNFYEPQTFSINQSTSADAINILYPRRLYEARGFYLICEILSEILSIDPRVTLTFLGSGDEQELDVAKKLVTLNPGRVFHHTESPEDVWGHYFNSDIVLIPTMYSEGTSLSAIEALSCGKIVIASDVGGLTDLIIDGFNGYLCQPTSSSFLATINKAIRNLDTVDDVRENAKKSVLPLEISRWVDAWRHIFVSYFPEPQIDSDTSKVIYFGSTEWLDLPQRAQGLLSMIASKRNTFYVNNSVHQGEDSVEVETTSEGVKVITITMPEGPWNAGFEATHEICTGISRNLGEFIANETAIVCGHPSWLIATKSFGCVKIYDRFDDWQAFSIPKTWSRSQILAFSKEYEDEAINLANGVVFTSQNLKVSSRPSLFLPNGFNSEKASLARKSLAGSTLKPNKAGFFGAFADWVEVDLIYQLALANPTTEFEIIGPVSVNVDSLEALSNVKFFPVMNQIALYVKALEWKIGLIPFKVNSLTASADPIKAYEYMSLGIPILASPLPSLNDFPAEGIRIYNDLEEALRLFQEMLLVSPQTPSLGLESWLSKQTWAERAEELIRFMDSLPDND